jgi:malate dehydrogenase (oxaloacetate-decarboxylating)
MVETVYTVVGEASVADAAALMVKKKISCLPVSMGQGAIGIVTEKDIIERVVAAGKDPRKVRVMDIMSTPLLLAPATMTIKEAADKMLEHQVRRLVVTSEGGKLTGLVTMTDIIRWISNKEGNPAYILKYLSDSIGGQTR